MSVYHLFNGCHVYSSFSFAGWGACLKNPDVIFDTPQPCLILEELGDGKVVDHPAATNRDLPQLKGFKTVCWPKRGILRSMCFPFEKATIWCLFFTTFPWLLSISFVSLMKISWFNPWVFPRRQDHNAETTTLEVKKRGKRMGKRPYSTHSNISRSLNERFFIFKNHGDVWLAPFWDFLASAMGTTGKNPITNYIHVFIVFTAEKQLLKVTDRIFEAPKIACKTNSCSFRCLPWNIFCKCFRSIHKISSNEKRYIQGKKPTSKT